MPSSIHHILNTNQAAQNIAAARREEQDKGKALRKMDVQTHIDDIEAQKQELNKRGRELMDEGKQDTPEYDKLIERHRFLRGKQRFFEYSQNFIDTDTSESGETSNKDRTQIKDRLPLEKGSEALDRLYQESK